MLTELLSQTRQQVNQWLDEYLVLPAGPEKRLVEAMRYACISTGKAFRPFLVLTISQMLNVSKNHAIRVACALEMLHSYSLIHDDLPCMDDDTMRRGKPTVHLAFDEATAVLAGDSLLTEAFAILADLKTHPDSKIRAKLVMELAKAAGMNGMAGGQMLDLIGEKETFVFEEIERLQSLKTGALIRYACLAPVWLADKDKNIQDAFSQYAQALGLLFQITDDILDAQGDPKIVGKTLKKDANAHKSTFVSTLGLEKAYAMAADLADKADKSLEMFGAKAALLKETTAFVLTRKK